MLGEFFQVHCDSEALLLTRLRAKFVWLEGENYFRMMRKISSSSPFSDFLRHDDDDCEMIKHFQLLCAEERRRLLQIVFYFEFQIVFLLGYVSDGQIRIDIFRATGNKQIDAASMKLSKKKLKLSALKLQLRELRQTTNSESLQFPLTAASQQQQHRMDDDRTS